MSIAKLIRDLTTAGATPEAIAIAVEAIEAVQNGHPTAPRIKRSDGPYLLYGINPRDWYALRAAVFRRDGYCCTYCGSERGDDPLHCDHVMPYSKGGTTTLDNLTTACRSCNTSKGDRTVEEWLGSCQ